MDFDEEKPVHLLEEEEWMDEVKMEPMDEEQIENMRLMKVQHDHTYCGKMTLEDHHLVERKSYKDPEEEERDFRDFLTKKCENVEKPFVLEELVKEYKTIFGSMRSTDFFLDIFRIVKHQVFLRESIDMDLNSKVKQIFALQVPVFTNNLKQLRRDAIVHTNENCLIICYLSFDGRLNLNWNHETRHPSKRMNLIQFIAEKCKSANNSTNVSCLIREYKSTTGTTNSAQTLRKLISDYRDNLHKINMDPITKLKQSFFLCAPISSKFLEKLRETGFVLVNKKNRIIGYELNDGNLKLGNMNQSEIFFNFLEKLCENVENPFVDIYLFEEFRRITGKFVTNNALNHIYCEYRNTIRKREDIDLNTKVKRMFGLNAPVDPALLIEFRKNAMVNINSMKRITFYRSHDGSLLLQDLRFGGSYSIKRKKESEFSRPEVKLEPFEGELNGYPMRTMDEEDNFIEEIPMKKAKVEQLLDPKLEFLDDNLISEELLDPKKEPEYSSEEVLNTKLEPEDVKFDLFE